MSDISLLSGFMQPSVMHMSVIKTIFPRVSFAQVRLELAIYSYSIANYFKIKLIIVSIKIT